MSEYACYRCGAWVTTPAHQCIPDLVSGTNTGTLNRPARPPVFTEDDHQRLARIERNLDDVLRVVRQLRDRKA